MTTAVLTRGICKVCSLSQKTRKNGKIGGHNGCKGAGKNPVKRKVTNTHVAIVLDDSWSMHYLRAEAVKAFNALLQPIKEQGDDYSVSYFRFSHGVHNEYSNLNPSDVPLLGIKDYTAEGRSTALYDAIGVAIDSFNDDGVSSYLLIVVTDGDENSSRRYTLSSVRELIKSRQATDRFTLAISCPRGSAETLSNSMVIPIGNFQEWDQTDQGTRDMGTGNTVAVDNFVASRSAGATNSTNFHTNVNIGRKSVKKVTKKLQLVAKNRFRKLTTAASVAIKPFIESKGLKFTRGCAFYMLQKPELVQSYKEIVLQRKDSGQLFAGPEVRDVLKIPVGRNGRVKPGNLGEWNIFIQSTSMNRKLLAKMVVLFDKTK